MASRLLKGPRNPVTVAIRFQRVGTTAQCRRALAKRRALGGAWAGELWPGGATHTRRRRPALTAGRQAGPCLEGPSPGGRRVDVPGPPGCTEIFADRAPASWTSLQRKGWERPSPGSPPAVLGEQLANTVHPGALLPLCVIRLFLGKLGKRHE